MNTKPRPAPPDGVLHVAHTPTASDATTLTLNVAEQLLAATEKYGCAVS